MKVDEYTKLNKVRQVKEPKNYKNFIHYYEGMPIEEPEIPTIEQVFIIVKSHVVNVKSHSDIKLRIDAEL